MKTFFRFVSLGTIFAIAAAALSASRLTAAEPLVLTGAGATFPYPIYSKWFDEYHKLHPDVRIDYQSIGSGGGIKQITEGTVDFGASDGPLTDQQAAASKTRILHFPTVLGADVPIYNIPELKTELKFTPEALAGIFLGTITQWNDPVIASANKGTSLPAGDIVVVHRSDGSGTTYIWTDYLSKVSPAWKSRVGAGTGVNWPVGLGAQGNEGVSGLVKRLRYSIGYVELNYALQYDLAFGRVRNASGAFVKADSVSVTAAAASSQQMPADFRVSITNPDGKDAYPIASFTWLLIPSRIPDSRKKEALSGFLRWMLADGQKFAKLLAYAPLPKEVVAKELKAIDLIR